MITGVLTLVVPTIQTIVHSFQGSGLFQGPGVIGRSGSSGFSNYSAVLGHGEFWHALAFSLSLGVIPLVVAVLVAPVLAAALHAGGAWTRRAGMILMSVPLVVFSPVAVAVAWHFAAIPGRPGSWIAPSYRSLSDPHQAPWALRYIAGFGFFGAVCGLALLIFLAVMRGRGRSNMPLTLGAVAVLVGLAMVAVSLQEFTVTSVVTAGGPGNSTQTLMTDQFRLFAEEFNLGASAAAAVALGVVLALAGLAATFIAILTRLHLDLDTPPAVAPAPARPARAEEPVTRQEPGPRPSPATVVLAVLALAAVLAVTVISMWPWLGQVLGSAGDGPVSTLRIYLNTWLPPVAGALVSVGSAFLAALGIGGLRPLGRHSEWLLVPFAPWLFVGIGPLSLAAYLNARHLHMLNTFFGLVPPILLSVPALLVLTLFCRGRSAHWQAQIAAGAPPAGAFWQTVVAPALPLAALIGGATVLFGAQGLLWPELASTNPRYFTAPTDLVVQLNVLASKSGIGLATPLLVVVLALAVMVVLQIFYLDKIVIRTEAPAPRPPAWPPLDTATGPG